MLKTYIRRIREVNPILNAVGEVNPDAFLIAQDLDNERAAGRVRGQASLICGAPAVQG